MKIHQLHQTQFLPISPENAWEYFATPKTLEEMTPEFLNFEILSDPPATLHSGLLIAYRIRAVAGIPMNWLTEIKHVVPLRRFVDEQRVGPFSFWLHEHTFTPVDGGIEMTDHVHYVMPWGPIGSLIHPLFVRRRLESIFSFRRAYLEKKFCFSIPRVCPDNKGL